MVSLLHPSSEYQLLAKYHDRLGWDCLLEGRICRLWVDAQDMRVQELNLRRSAESWAKGFIRRLLLTTHRQWIFRNSAVHHKVEGLTLLEHEALMKKCEEYIMLEPLDLLPEHRDLLQLDFVELGEGPAIDRQYWVADMEAAVEAADHVRQGRAQALRTRYGSDAMQRVGSVRVDVLVDNEGSIRWRRRRRRT